jgi:hypothetical protein
LARRSLGIATFILAGSLAADFIVPKVWRLVYEMAKCRIQESL